MPLSSIQHEWFLAPFDHDGLSLIGARPDCARKTLTIPSQSFASGAEAVAVLTGPATTSVEAIAAMPSAAVIHPSGDRREGRSVEEEFDDT
jgi:hypothetical protein